MPGQGQEGIEEGLRPFVFLISLSSRKVLFNGEGGNRAQASRPMRGRLEIIRGIAGRTAASESGGEVRLGEVMFAPRVSLTFDGPVPARHRSRKRWGSVSSIGVRHFFFFFFFFFFYLYFFPYLHFFSSFYFFFFFFFYFRRSVIASFALPILLDEGSVHYT